MQTYQILSNDEVCTPSLSSILLAVTLDLQFICHCLRTRSVQNNPLCALPALKNGYHFQVIFQKVDEHMGSRFLLGYSNIM